MEHEVGYPLDSGALSGLLGGLLGALVLGGIASMMPVPPSGMVFFVAAVSMMGMGGAAVAVGWALHIATGLVVGVIFGLVTSKVPRLLLRNVARGLALGILTGIIVWLGLFMPMMGMLMPALMGMGTIVAGSLMGHVVYGLILGGVAGVLMPKSAVYRCPACGASYKLREELVEHIGEKHKA